MDTAEDRVPCRVRVTCRAPSQYESARRHGGKCNWCADADTFTELREAFVAHIDEFHPNGQEVPT